MKHLFKGLIAATAVASVLAGSTATAEEPRRGGTLKTQLGNNLRTLNSAVQSGIVTGFPGLSCLPRRCAMTTAGRRSLTWPKAGTSATMA